MFPAYDVSLPKHKPNFIFGTEVYHHRRLTHDEPPPPIIEWHVVGVEYSFVAVEYNVLTQAKGRDDIILGKKVPSVNDQQNQNEEMIRAIATRVYFRHHQVVKQQRDRHKIVEAVTTASTLVTAASLVVVGYNTAISSTTDVTTSSLLSPSLLFLTPARSSCSGSSDDGNNDNKDKKDVQQLNASSILSKRTTSPSTSSSNKKSFVDSIVPTIEAMIRGIRLVNTTILMVMDYEMAKIMPYTTYIFATNEQISTDETRKYWEQQVEICEKELDTAQLLYTGKIQKEPTTPTSSSGEDNEDEDDEDKRREIKRQQKVAMHVAAQNLAHAEEELNKLGGESIKSQLHRRAAHRLLKLCQTNGGVYIKVGQHLANLDYLIPSEYIEVLSTLFNNAPQSSMEDVYQVIQEDLHCQNIDEIYDNFNPIPIASASLAQVHVAYDKLSGKKLAVKVQHRGLRETSVGDIVAVTTVVKLVDWLFDDFTFGWIVDEIAPNLPKELDFTREGRNSELASYHLKKEAASSSSSSTALDCVIPKVVWSKTSNRVLTMEFEEGFKTTDTQAMEESGLNKRYVFVVVERSVCVCVCVCVWFIVISPRYRYSHRLIFSRSDVAKLVSSVFFSQVFLSSWVHCDPHPANVLLRKNQHGKPQMVLVGK